LLARALTEPKETLAAAGSNEAVEGMVNTLLADPGNQGYQRIAAEYKKSIGQDPTRFSLHTMAPHAFCSAPSKKAET
jgi:hypothetical protein